MRFQALVLAGSVAWSAQVMAAEPNPRPTGVNCDLVAPPAAAGEEFNHGLPLRIFPRAGDIGSSYSGCQVVFAPNEDKWTVVSLTEVVKGDPVRVWVSEAVPAMDCRFAHGKVVRGDPEKCPVPAFLLMKSMAPGCVEIIRAAVAKDGLGAPRPKECEAQ